MLESTPAQAVRELDEAFARRDLEAVLAFYEDDAVVVIEPGHLARGMQELRALFAHLFTLDGKAEQLEVAVLEAAGLALFTSRWRFSVVGPDNSVFSRESIATSVLRRSADGQWRLVIDNSYGPAILRSFGADT